MAKPKHNARDHFHPSPTITADMRWEDKHAKPEIAPDPVMRARVSTMLKKLARDLDPAPLHRSARRSWPPPIAEAQQAIATGFSHLQGPLTVSNALRASLGLTEASGE